SAPRVLISLDGGFQFIQRPAEILEIPAPHGISHILDLPVQLRGRGVRLQLRASSPAPAAGGAGDFGLSEIS
ncbi:hypothetical protein, partial [Nocardia asiatica]|uniref:hypothetical protein n=1 Tax=Nocardia asiatica TaxID=209252 RepID=UPI002457C83F